MKSFLVSVIKEMSKKLKQRIKGTNYLQQNDPGRHLKSDNT